LNLNLGFASVATAAAEDAPPLKSFAVLQPRPKPRQQAPVTELNCEYCGPLLFPDQESLEFHMHAHHRALKEAE